VTHGWARLRDVADVDSLGMAVRAVAALDVATLDELERGISTAMRPAARIAVAVLGRVASDITPGHVAAGDVPVEALRRAAVLQGSEAVLNGWCLHLGLGCGMLAGAAASITQMSGSGPTLPVPAGVTALGAGDRAMDWRIAVLEALAGRLEPLERIRVALELSETELGALFGVSRQAVAQWREKGIPANRSDAVAHVLQTVDLLDRKLKAGRLPLIARRPTARLGGRSILQALTSDPAGTHEVFASAFDWASAA
jgi:transcriptional regulator with XRE-family HTH domain